MGPIRVAAGAAGIAAVLAAAGCGSPSGNSATGGKIAVVASTNVWGSVVDAVGGDAVAVTSLITGGSADPHAYQDKPEDAVKLAGAQLIVSNGGGYDDFFGKLADAAGGRGNRIVAFDLAGKGQTGSANEHVWYDFGSVRTVADKVADELGTLDPDHKDTFAANARAFGTRLDELAVKAAKIGTDHPGAQVACTEPIPEYLLDAAGLRNATPEEFSEAIEEETDPPAAAVAEIDKLVGERQVAAVVNNAQTESPVTRALRESANKSGVPVVDVTETLPQGVTSYVDWMTRQLDTLAGALAKTS